MLKNDIYLVFYLSFTACNKDNDVSSSMETVTSTTINKGDDPNFKIGAHTDNGFSKFNRKVVVFDIDIYAVPQVADANLLHAANLLAQ